MAYQRANFPMKVITLTQGYGPKTSTHKYSYALDLAGKDGGKDEVFAPFDCYISKLYQKKGRSTEVWLTSTHKVLCANGYYGYLTMSITHPTEIFKMKLGTKYKKGQVICHEGREGGATGNHIHLELSKGRRAGWDLVRKDGKIYYVNVNKIKPEEYLFVIEDGIIKDNEYKGDKYNFIKEKDITYKVVNVPEEPLNIHRTADYKSSSIIKDKGLKNGDEVLKFYKKGNMSYIYHYETMGYVADKYLQKTR